MSRGRALARGGLLGLLLLGHAPEARAGGVEECLAAAEEGEPLKKQGRLVAAKQRLTTCARDVCPAAVRTVCRGYLGEVEDALPTIVVVVRDAQNKELASPKVLVDGVAVTARPDGAIELDPGPRTVRVEHPALTSERLVEVASGKKRTPVVFTAAAPSPVIMTVKPEPPPDVPKRRSSTTTWAWITGGVGVGALTGSGIFAAKWLSDASCRPGCSSDEVSRVQTDAVITDVFLGSGIVLVSISAVLFLMDR